MSNFFLYYYLKKFHSIKNLKKISFFSLKIPLKMSDSTFIFKIKEENLLFNLDKLPTLKTLFPDILFLNPSDYTDKLKILFKEDDFNQFYPVQYQKEILTLLFNYFMNIYNPTNLSILKENLSRLLTPFSAHSYHFLKLLLILNIFEHYPSLNFNYPTLFQYFSNLKTLNQKYLFDFRINNAPLPESNLESYFNHNFYKNSFLNFYSRYGTELMNRFYHEGKMTVFGQQLAYKLVNMVGKNPITTTKNWPSYTYSAINNEFAEIIASLKINSTFKISGFQKQALNLSKVVESIDKNDLREEIRELDEFDDFEKEIDELKNKFSLEKYEKLIRNNSSLPENSFSFAKYEKYIRDELINDELINKNSTNFKIILKIIYPREMKFLALTNPSSPEILTYPNQTFRLVDKYINNLLVVCVLEYDYFKTEVEIVKEINLVNFDYQFLTVLDFLNQEILYRHWLAVYLYFLDHLEILERIMEKNNLMIKLNDANFYSNYLNNFERYLEKKIKNGKRREDIDFILENEDEENEFWIDNEILNNEEQNELKKYIEVLNKI